MTGITIATIGAAIVMLAVVFLAARSTPRARNQPKLEVHVDLQERIWIIARTRRRLLPDREIWVELSNADAQDLRDKLHLSAYAAQFHLRSDDST